MRKEDKMSKAISRIKNVGKFISVPNIDVDKLLDFQCESIIITISKDELENLIEETENKEEREFYKELLNEYSIDDDVCDFTIG